MRYFKIIDKHLGYRDWYRYNGYYLEYLSSIPPKLNKTGELTWWKALNTSRKPRTLEEILDMDLRYKEISEEEFIKYQLIEKLAK